MSLLKKKELVLIALNLCLSAIVFWCISAVVGWIGGVIAILAAVLLLMAWVAVLGVSLAVGTSIVAYSLILVIPWLVVLIGGWSLQTVSVAVVLLVILLLARARLMMDVNSRIAYTTYTAFAKAARILVAGAVIVLFGVAFSDIAGALTTKDMVSAESVRPMIALMQPVLTEVSDGILANTSIDRIIGDQIDGQTDRAGVSRQAAQKQKQAAVEELSKQLGQPIALSDDIADVIARGINSNVKIFVNANPLMSTILLLLLLLVLLRVFLPILVLPVIGLISALILFMRQMDFVYLCEVETSVDKLSLSGEG